MVLLPGRALRAGEQLTLAYHEKAGNTHLMKNYSFTLKKVSRTSHRHTTPRGRGRSRHGNEDSMPGGSRSNRLSVRLSKL